MSALDRIKKQVEESPVILYMKGTPNAYVWFFLQGLWKL